LDGVVGLVFYNPGAPNGAFPKPNSTENTEEAESDAQHLGIESFTPQGQVLN
jgi:hypothetical protein